MLMFKLLVLTVCNDNYVYDNPECLFDNKQIERQDAAVYRHRFNLPVPCETMAAI